MFEIFGYEFMQRAVLATILTSLACGVIGVYIVTKKIVFIAGGISHSCFGGLGLSFYLGLNPLIGLLPFSVISALTLGILSKKTKVSEDTAIGILWSLGVAVGIILIYLTPGYAPDLMTYLFGNILTVPASDIWLMVGIDIVILLTVVLFYKEFLAMCFDEEFTKVTGVSADALYLILLALIALAVVAMIKVVGIILIIAMLSIPASISRKFSHNMKTMMIYSSVIGAILSFAGLYLSYAFDLPSGAVIIMVMGTVYLVISGVSYLRQKVNQKKFAADF
ncbi:Manganese transport system membrane protein MntB [Methanosarcinaceae archaeon Ag5]|uniref:Manganese transport system membrane protein MntB n=1 Tax=Methanolapillus africanus TaxID=3028297 RepID=A0AAE4SCC8_9EURY|nr:Manganese transport system membrane protein MntB [Methanosarcinaceae archaeon Ag5]